MRILIHIFFIVLFLLITFFGMGPVIFADGIMSERMATFAIVIVLYGIWVFLYRLLLKKVSIKK